MSLASKTRPIGFVQQKVRKLKAPAVVGVFPAILPRGDRSARHGGRFSHGGFESLQYPREGVKPPLIHTSL